MSDEFGELSDQQLLDRESADRIDYLRLTLVEPLSGGTTYRVIPASYALLAAWLRWTQSGGAARLRGLVPQRGGRG